MTCWFDWLKAKAQIQGSSLGNAVIAFCGNCDQLEALGPTIVKYQLISNETAPPPRKKKRIDRKYTVIPTRVANRHVSLEVTPDQYNVVGGTLLASLEVL